MVELVDTLDSKSNDSNIVPVRVRPWAPKRINRTILVRFLLSQIIKIMIKHIMIDTIADSKNNYEENKNTSFSSTMMEVLSSLSKEDLSFIMLKYQEDFSDDELESILNLTIDEIKQKEIEILSLLKKDENLKLLKMSNKDN